MENISRMKRLKKIGLAVLLVTVQVLVVCWIVDFAFKKYEAKYLYQYASKDAPSYLLEDFLYNDTQLPIPKKKPAGQFRILVFGDSYTYAVTQPPYSFCSVLERRLGQIGPWKDVRVVNLGFPSISFPEYLEMFYFWSQALEYDAVIFNVYLGNDFNDVRETPYEPAALQQRLDALCQLGLPYGKDTLIPHKYPFRFMDCIKAKVLDEMHGNPRWRHFFSIPELPKAAGTPATPAAAPGIAPTAAQAVAAAPPGTAATAPAAPPATAATFPNPVPAINPALYRTLTPITPDQMTSEMRSSLKPFVRESLLAYANNLPWYRLFLATAAQEAARGVPVLVMLSPPLCAVSPAVRTQAAKDLGVPPESVDLTLPRRLTLELARQVGLAEEAVIDFTPCLKEKTPSGETTYTGVETHWSVAGNAWVGELLTKAVAARWLRQDPGDEVACPAPATAPGSDAPLLSPAEAKPDAATAALAHRIVTGCPPAKK
jgi:hypothetical protein